MIFSVGDKFLNTRYGMTFKIIKVCKTVLRVCTESSILSIQRSLIEMGIRKGYIVKES